LPPKVNFSDTGVPRAVCDARRGVLLVWSMLAGQPVPREG